MGSASKASAPKMWKGILVAVLITFFLLQVWESLLKFVKRQVQRERNQMRNQLF